MKKFFYDIRFILYGWVIGIIVQSILYLLFGVIVDTIKEVTGFILLTIMACTVLASPTVKLDKTIFKNK